MSREPLLLVKPLDFFTAREMLHNLLMETNLIDIIIIFLDITGRKPWCGHAGLKCLLSEKQQYYLAHLACYLLFDIIPPEATPGLFSGYGHIQVFNFDEVLAAFLSKGVKERGKYVFINVIKIAVIFIIASLIVLGFMLIIFR